MNIDQAIAVMVAMLENSAVVAGPLLLAALLGGVLVGVIQTATQINEMSVAFVVKAACVGLVFVVAGTAIAERAVRYTHDSFASIADVGR
jgi:flagellar biosynthesis protein FliQ